MRLSSCVCARPFLFEKKKNHLILSAGPKQFAAIFHFVMTSDSSTTQTLQQWISASISRGNFSDLLLIRTLNSLSACLFVCLTGKPRTSPLCEQRCGKSTMQQHINHIRQHADTRRCHLAAEKLWLWVGKAFHRSFVTAKWSVKSGVSRDKTAERCQKWCDCFALWFHKSTGVKKSQRLNCYSD